MMPDLNLLLSYFSEKTLNWSNELIYKGLRTEEQNVSEQRIENDYA